MKFPMIATTNVKDEIDFVKLVTPDVDAIVVVVIS